MLHARFASRLSCRLVLTALVGLMFAVPAAWAGEEKKEKPDFPPFEEVAKKYTKMPAPDGAFWSLYYNKKKDGLLAVIPKGMLGKNFLMATSIAGGPRMTGFMWGDSVVQWQEMDKKLVLIEPDLRYKTGGKSEVGDVIRRTYTESIVLATPIVTRKDGDPVINLNKITKSDYAGVAGLFGGSVDASLSRYAKRKVFPKNVELAVDLAVMRGKSGGTRARVHYSISELPENGYKPRVADDRVGYFMTAVKDWTQPHNARTIFHRYIHRWWLRKDDPSAEVSDVNPDDQIIFYIEKTVPKQYRQYVREGILEWNKAFEKAGLRNVLQVRQQTDKTFANIDPEDVRYNFFRWIVSGRSFAMGPSRANPLTGQILDADIIFDDSMVRTWEARYADWVAKGPTASYDPQLAEFLKNNPEWGFEPISRQLHPHEHSVSGVDIGWDHEIIAELQAHAHAPGFCTYANGMAHEMVLGQAMLEATGNLASREEFIGQSIRETTTHEVGHTLGLRHNFKASAWKSMDEIMKITDKDTPISASVMDYNPTMFALEAEKQPLFVTNTLGPYDDWAIEYGYRTTNEEFKTEEELLKSITSRCAEPGLAYATDFDTSYFDPDPLVNRFDNGDDPIAYAKQRLAMVKKLLPDIEDWAVKEGESWNQLRRSFDMLIFEVSRSSHFAARYIGGQFVSRDHKGDPNAHPPFVIVPAAKQREALQFLLDNIFSDKLFKFEPALLNKLGPGRWRHWDSDAYDSVREYPVHDRVAAIQSWALFHIMNPSTITRLYDAQLKVPADEDALTVPELMTTLARGVWSEVTEPPTKKFTDRQPYISSMRRNLQRRHMENMINVVIRTPGKTMPADAHAITRMTLSGIAQQIDEVLAGEQAANLDNYSRAHLTEAKLRIGKALEAEFEL